MCKDKYDMIVDSPNSSFWQAVYDCAQEWAQKNDAILNFRKAEMTMTTQSWII